jgi:uncharacterized membrane protein YcaP (DUF421 family)
MTWESVFAVHTSLWELVARGTTMYWFLFLLFRFVLRRDIGQIGVSTIAARSWFLDWLAYRSPLMARFVEPRVLPLVRNSRLVPDNLRRELLTEAELMSQLREQGITSLKQIRHAFLGRRSNQRDTHGAQGTLASLASPGTTQLSSFFPTRMQSFPLVPSG